MTPRDSHNYLSLRGDARARINRRRAMGAVVMLVTVFAGYTIIQMKDVLFAPDITITSPMDGATLSGSVEIRGSVDQDATLHMNGYQLVQDDNGNISADLPLAEGLHVLEFEARSSLGKVSHVRRQIVVQ